jgi:hypothetical protein
VGEGRRSKQEASNEKAKVNLHSHNHRLKKIKKPENHALYISDTKAGKKRKRKVLGKSRDHPPLPLTLIIFGAYISRPLTSTKVKDIELFYPAFRLGTPTI